MQEREQMLTTLDEFNLGLVITTVEQLISGLSVEELARVADICAAHEGYHWYHHKQSHAELLKLLGRETR